MKLAMKSTTLAALLSCFFLSSPASAYLAISESGEISSPGQFRIGIEPQVRISDGSGGNVGFFADSALNEELSWRAQGGTGETEFWAGGSLKWVPIPDYESQPAIGLRPEIIFGRDERESLTVFRLAPIVSKKLDTEIGGITPYASLPFGILAWGGKSETISHLVIGTEGRFIEMPSLLFTAELGMNMNKTFSYVSGSISFFFDSSR